MKGLMEIKENFLAQFKLEKLFSFREIDCNSNSVVALHLRGGSIT